MPVKIFFCYAHEDESLLIQLKMHLKPLERQGLIEIWYDRKIGAGTEWEREISRRLNEAHIILLLISPDFMNSDYCYGTELQRALEKHKRREALVVPIIARPIHWQGVLGQLQALPKDALPITDPGWYGQDRALHNVTEGLRKIVDLLLFNQRRPEEKAPRPAFPIQNLASPRASIPAPQPGATISPNAPLSPFTPSLQSSPTSNGARFVTQSPPLLPSAPPPSSTASSLFDIQRENEMFEKDMIFEEYIIKRMQQNTIPPTWRIYQPSRSKIIGRGLTLGISMGFFVGVLVAEILVLPITSGASLTLLLLSIPIALLSGGLTYAIYWYSELAKKQSLVLTPNGCICFQKGVPRYMIRYSLVKQIKFYPLFNKKLRVNTNALSFWMSLANFETPDTLAQHIDYAYTLFVTSHGGSRA